MDDSESPLKQNPFEKLGMLLKAKAVLRPVPVKPIVSVEKPIAEPAEAPQPVSEESAFREAMEGVKPIIRDKYRAEKTPLACPPTYLGQ